MDLVSREVSDRVAEIRQKFNQQYFSRQVSVDEGSELFVSPIEKIFFSSLSTSAQAGDAFVNPMGDFVVAVSHADSTISISTSSQAFKLRSPASGLVILSEARLLVACDTFIYLYSDSGAELTLHELKSPVKTMVSISESRAVVNTADDAVYLISIGSESLSHQLLIAANQSSLGSIQRLCYSGSSERLLAVVGTSSILILELGEKPKLLYKKSVNTCKSRWAVWLNTSLILDSCNFCLRKSSSSGFFETISTAPITADHAVGISDTVLATVLGTKLKLYSEARALKSEFDLHACSFLLVPRRDTNVPVPIFVISPTAIHKISVTKWIENIFSLVHAEKFSEAISLLLALKRGHMPLLMDSRESLDDQTLIVGIAGKCLKKVDMVHVVELAAEFKALDEVCEILVAGTKADFFQQVRNLTVSGRIQITSLSQEIVMKAIEYASNTDELDAFISSIIIRSKSEILLDTNQVIRTATAKDLGMAVALIHIHLLHDHMYPIKYWLSAGKCELISYYLYCLSRGLRFPCMDQSVETTEVVKNLIIEERSVFEKIVLADPHMVLNCIGWGLEEELRAICMQHPDLQEPLAIFELKSAISDDRLDAFLENRIQVSECVKMLVKNSETDLVLTLLERKNSQVSNDVVLMVFETLLAESADSDQVIRFAMRFNLDTDRVVQGALGKDRTDVAVKMFARKQRLKEALDVLTKVKDYELKRSLVVWITDRFAKTAPQDKLIDLWLQVLGASDDVMNNIAATRALATSGIDLILLASRADDMSHKAWLMNINQHNLDLIAQACAVSAYDVGTQFSIMSKTDSARSKGISITASICHSCLDPISAKSSKKHDIMLYSCGHIVHSACGDRTGCPVCI